MDSTAGAIVQVDAALLTRALARLAGEDQDSMLPPTKMRLMANPEFVEKASYVIAALDHVRYERRTPEVFSQRCIRLHCNECMREIVKPQDDIEAAVGLAPFDIDAWFAAKRGQGTLAYDPSDPLANIDQVHFNGELAKEVDWLQVIVNQECETPGFTKTLHNCLQMEEKIIEQLKRRNAAVMPRLASGWS